MRAYLRSVRIAPKKANLVAALVRRMRTEEALKFLNHLPKKGARIIHALIASAVANAEHQAAQDRRSLFLKSIVVQKGPAFRRSIPMARGRTRPIDKWTSHITVELGVLIPAEGSVPASSMAQKTEVKTAETLPGTEAAVIHGGPVPAAPLPLASAPARPPERRSKGMEDGRGPKGPTFQPHRRGGRGG